MPHRSVPAALGLPPSAESLYRQVLAGSGHAVEDLALDLLMTPDELLSRLHPLQRLGLVSVEGGLVHVAPPPRAVATAMSRTAEDLARTAASLSRLARAVPDLDQGHGRPVGRDEQLDGDVQANSDVPEMISEWIRTTSGEVCFLRPDQWRLPSESKMAVAVGSAVRGGRRVRAIYPTRALSEAQEVLSSHAELGEEIRIVPTVPTRMAIVGTLRAVLPDPIGTTSTTRLVVRQRGIVQVMQAYFDQLWESASVVPSFDPAGVRADLRRQLLRQMADGVKDEQIARNLGLGLRTVRRRVADLMVDLGVDTRFQAGVEAARRGWL